MANYDLQFEKHPSLYHPDIFDRHDGRVAETGPRIFIRVPISLGNNLAGGCICYFFGFVARLQRRRVLFSLTSVCRAPCAAIPLAICNCFRSATKNETRNEDPDSRGL